MASDEAMANATTEWTKWEGKLLLFGEVESRSSKALQKKLLGKHSYIILELTIKCTCLISDVQNECDTAKSLFQCLYPSVMTFIIIKLLVSMESS